MILQNSYNILGLDITSTQKQITKRGKDILKYVAIGEYPDFDNDLYFSKEFRNEVYVKEAIDNLSNPKKRLLNVFFWFDIDREEDKELFSLINNKDFKGAISLLENSDNIKNLIILYGIILLNKDINSIELDSTPIELSEKLTVMLDNLSTDKKFWKVFEQKFYLHDDLSTDKKILKEFQTDFGGYLSDLFYDISKNIGDDNVLKTFNKHFKNTKGSKTNNEVDALYGELTKIVEKLEGMDISEDGVFDDDEKAELKNTYKEINKILKKIKDIGLYDDSKTLLIRDNLVKALRIIMLDLSNNLKEDEEVLSVLKFALKIVGTDGLKHKIKEEYEIISENIELKPIIQLIDEGRHKAAYIRLNKLEEANNDKKKEESIKSLKKQAVFSLLSDDFLKAKKLFESETYGEATELFKKVEELAEENTYLFDIEQEGLKEIIAGIRKYIKELGEGKYESKDVFEYIDKIRDGAVKNLGEWEGYFCIFYIDSISYGFISDLNANPSKTGKPAFLYTLNGVGVSIYGDTTYVTILWIPIIPLSSWNVKSLGNSQYSFSGKKEMATWKRIWKYLILLYLFITIAIAMGEGSSSSTSNSSYKSNNYSTSTNYDDGEAVGDYYCRSYHVTKAKSLFPADPGLQTMIDELTRLEKEYKNMNYDKYSQTSIDIYNAKIDNYNKKFDTYESARLIYNNKVDKYNNYLDTNCTKK